MAPKLLASLASLGLISAPLAAHAAKRLPSPVAANEQLAEEGSIGRWIIGIGLFVGIVAWIIVDAGDDEEEPVSP